MIGNAIVLSVITAMVLAGMAAVDRKGELGIQVNAQVNKRPAYRAQILRDETAGIRIHLTVFTPLPA